MSAAGIHLHFETRANKPAVFRMTAPEISAAKSRSGSDASVSLGEDPHDLSWLPRTTGLITSNDVLLEPGFPRAELAFRAPLLRWIHIIGAGIEPLLPLAWLPPGAVLTNNSGVHVDKARESATMALLMLHARLPTLTSQQRHREWHPIFTSRIAGRRLLVVGVGNMGGAIAAAGRALGLHVTGVRRNGMPHPDVEHMATPDALDRLLPEADLVALAAPLTPHTRHMLDARRLGLMKLGAGLYNVGRGGLIDHDALIERLTSGALGGAILDVFDPEPLPSESPLWHTDNLLIMPHVTSDDLDTYLPDTFDLVFANAALLAAGAPLRNRVDPEWGY
jgi:phosphoglycerate dehydrogenase-like enzyme